MTIKELKEHLKMYPDNTACAWALWLPDDVKAIARRKKVVIPEDEIENILEDFNNHHDANNGLTWGNLESEVDDYLRNLEEENSNIKECKICKEKKVYIIDCDDNEDFGQREMMEEKKEKIKERAKKMSTVYSLQAFQNAINDESLWLNNSFILID